jgi:hypothetical protein
MHGLTPLPRLKDQNILKISEIVDSETDFNSGLIIDFLGWENTYFIALDASLRPKQIIFMPGETHNILPLNDCYKILSERENGIILISKNSKLDEILLDKSSSVSIELNKNHYIDSIYSDSKYKIIKWRKKIN